MEKSSIVRHDVFSDEHGRQIIQYVPVVGELTDADPEFVGQAQVQVEHAQRTPEGTTMVPCLRDLAFPIYCDRGDLQAAFQAYDEHKDAARLRMIEDTRAEVLRQMKEQADTADTIETPIHDPTLPERHLDRDGNPGAPPAGAGGGGIILP